MDAHNVGHRTGGLISDAITSRAHRLCILLLQDMGGGAAVLGAARAVAALKPQGVQARAI